MYLSAGVGCPRLTIAERGIAQRVSSRYDDADSHCIIRMAGELDDRWLALTPPRGERRAREESPDTTLREQSRVACLVTPGEAARNGCFTESATENIPPAERIPVIARRKTFGTSSNGTQRR